MASNRASLVKRGQTGSDYFMLANAFDYAAKHNFDGKACARGNGHMTALFVADTALVDKLHAKALALGGSDEGAPGPRGDGFYGAYFRDLDGNKLCFFNM